MEEFLHSDIGERMGEFLKLCFHSDMGLSVKGVLSSVLIWDHLCQGRSAVSPVKFSSYSQGPEMAVLVLTLNLKWNGLDFSWPPHFPLTEEPKEGPNHGSRLVSE